MKGEYIKIGARNLIKGKIVSVESGEVVSNIKVQITGNSDIIAAIITRDTVDDLQLGEEDEVALIIKSTIIIVQNRN